jgi:hypothetical protein
MKSDPAIMHTREACKHNRTISVMHQSDKAMTLHCEPRVAGFASELFRFVFGPELSILRL